MTILMCAQKLTDASLIYRTGPKTKTSRMKKTKKNTDKQRGTDTQTHTDGGDHCTFRLAMPNAKCNDCVSTVLAA